MSDDDRTLPAGTYWVGDPGYVQISDADHELGAKALFDGPYRDDYANWSHHATFDASVGRIAEACTKYGDGGYAFEVGRGARVEHRPEGGGTLAVDSGCIGAVPITEANAYKVIQQLYLGAVIRFHEPFSIEYNKETGDITLGPVVVHTGDDVTAEVYDEDDES